MGQVNWYLKMGVEVGWQFCEASKLHYELNQPDQTPEASAIVLVNFAFGVAKVLGDINSNFKVPDMDVAVEHIKSQLRNKPLPIIKMFLEANEPGHIFVESLECVGVSLDPPSLEVPSLTAVPVASAPNLAPADAKPAASFALYGPVFDPTKLLGGVYQGFKVRPQLSGFLREVQ